MHPYTKQRQEIIMSIIRKLNGFARSLVIALIGSAALGYGLFAPKISPLEQARAPDHSQGVNRVLALEGGCHLVWFADNRLVKYDRQGGALWESPFERLAHLEPTSINGIAGDLDANILVLGVNDSRSMALHIVDGQTGEVDLVRQYPGMEPNGIGIAPDGTVYLIAFSAKRMNDILLNPSSLPLHYSDDILHQLDSDGAIVRSFGRVSTQPKSVQDLADFLSDVTSRRLAFSPKGEGFLVDRDRFEIERIDLKAGRMTGARTVLSAGRAAHHAQIESLQFLDDTILLYTVSRLAKPDALTRRGRLIAAGIVGWEARALNLETGRGERIKEGTVRDLSEVSYSPYSDEVHLVRILNSAAKRRKQVMDAERIRLRLGSRPSQERR